jgi:hypothetical protein
MYETSDLAFAAYLLTKKFKLISAKKSLNKFEFVFEDKENIAETLSVEYLNSELYQFDNSIKVLKKLLYSKK